MGKCVGESWWALLRVKRSDFQACLIDRFQHLSVLELMICALILDDKTSSR
jgi:hypothetical protein